MPNQLRFALSLAALLGTAALSHAAPITIQTTGTFSSSDTQNALASPGAPWQLSFTADNQPAATNIGTDGFDLPFSNFAYTLNGQTVAASPDSIRLYGAANNGLFTVFFGPESGVDASGGFIPEFTFSGPQLFSGFPANPMISSGSYSVSEWLYTDSMNYDDQLHPGTAVTVGAGTATPEPASVALVFSGFLLAYGYRRLGASRAIHLSEVRHV